MTREWPVAPLAERTGDRPFIHCRRHEDGEFHIPCRHWHASSKQDQATETMIEHECHIIITTSERSKEETLY